jgi:type IV secretory pathway VirB2 component (pilin)
MSTQNNTFCVNALFLLGIGVAVFFSSTAVVAPWDSTATKVLNVSTRLVQNMSIVTIMVCCIAAYLERLSWYQSINISAGMFIIFFVASIMRMF